MLRALILIVTGTVVCAGPAASQEKPKYVVGGPLAGVPLPLFPTQHGEPPGYPGVIPGSGNTREDLASSTGARTCSSTCPSAVSSTGKAR